MKIKTEMNEREAKKYFEKNKSWKDKVNIKLNLDTAQKRRLCVFLIGLLFVSLFGYWFLNYSGKFVRKEVFDNTFEGWIECENTKNINDMTWQESLNFALKKNIGSWLGVLIWALAISWIFHGVGFKVITIN